MSVETPTTRRTKILSDLGSPMTIPPSPFMTKLGCGTGVVVYRFQRTPRPSISARTKSPWAIKKVKEGFRDCSKRLKREAEILRSLDHPYVVKFKGTGLTQTEEFCLSMEECGKSLESIIEERNDEEELMLTAREVLQVSTFVIKALSYLHDEKHLLHGDIKSGNVLVKGDFDEIKLCDFGVSIFLNDDLSGPLNPEDIYIGTEPWKSPEVLEWNDGPITDKADIFAYGLVIWEMLTLQCPHVDLVDVTNSSIDTDGSFLSNDTNNETNSQYYDALGTRPPLPNEEYGPEYDTVIEIFLCCTQADYKVRPSATTISHILQENSN